MKHSKQDTEQQGQEQGQDAQTDQGRGVGGGSGEKTPQAPEQTAELRALTVAAQGGELEAVEGDEQAAPRIPLDQELAGLLAGVVAIVAPAFPSIKGIYTPEVVGAVSASVAAVCTKHGWMNDGVMGKWGEEIGCAFVVMPLAFVTYQAVAHDLARMAIEKAKAKAKESEAIPGAVDRATVQGDATA